MWVEPYILYKHGFHKPLWDYFSKYVVYFFETIILFAVSMCSTKWIMCNNWGNWILKGIIVFGISTCSFMLLNFKRKEFKDLKGRILDIFYKIMKKRRTA